MRQSKRLSLSNNSEWSSSQQSPNTVDLRRTRRKGALANLADEPLSLNKDTYEGSPDVNNVKSTTLGASCGISVNSSDRSEMPNVSEDQSEFAVHLESSRTIANTKQRMSGVQYPERHLEFGWLKNKPEFLVNGFPVYKGMHALFNARSSFLSQSNATTNSGSYLILGRVTAFASRSDTFGDGLTQSEYEDLDSYVYGGASTHADTLDDVLVRVQVYVMNSTTITSVIPDAFESDINIDIPLLSFVCQVYVITKSDLPKLVSLRIPSLKEAMDLYHSSQDKNQKSSERQEHSQTEVDARPQLLAIPLRSRIFQSSGRILIGRLEAKGAVNGNNSNHAYPSPKFVPLLPEWSSDLSELTNSIKHLSEINGDNQYCAVYHPCLSIEHPKQLREFVSKLPRFSCDKEIESEASAIVNLLMFKDVECEAMIQDLTKFHMTSVFTDENEFQYGDEVEASSEVLRHFNEEGIALKYIQSNLARSAHGNHEKMVPLSRSEKSSETKEKLSLRLTDGGQSLALSNLQNKMILIARANPVLVTPNTNKYIRVSDATDIQHGRANVSRHQHLGLSAEHLSHLSLRNLSTDQSELLKRIGKADATLLNGNELGEFPHKKQSSGVATSTPQYKQSGKVSFEIPALQMLHGGRLPVAPGEPLPCREKEFDTIYSFVSSAIMNGIAPGSLYISGLPGTGKTATCHQVVRRLESEVQHENLPAFHCVEVNGTKLADPSAIYSVLWRAVSGESVSSASAERKLDTHFSDSSAWNQGAKRRGRKSRSQIADYLPDGTANPFIVLIVDEIDYLISKNQSVLYNLVEWPSRKNSRLLTIGLSNTFDLPDQLFSRVRSRMGLTRVAFAPYSHKDIFAIVKSRLLAASKQVASSKPSTILSDKEKREVGTQAPLRRVLSMEELVETKDVLKSEEVVNTEFDDSAIELCARKVAAVSGDARRALTICKAAVHIAFQENETKFHSAQEHGDKTISIDFGHIDQAVNRLFNSSISTVLKGLSQHESTVLTALLLVTRDAQKYLAQRAQNYLLAKDGDTNGSSSLGGTESGTVDVLSDIVNDLFKSPTLKESRSKKNSNHTSIEYASLMTLSMERPAVTLFQVYAKVQILCRMRGISPPLLQCDVLNVLRRLSELEIVTVLKGASHVRFFVSLRCSQDEVVHALKDHVVLGPSVQNILHELEQF